MLSRHFQHLHSTLTLTFIISSVWSHKPSEMAVAPRISQSCTWLCLAFHPFSSIFIRGHPSSSTFIHLHPLSLTFIHFIHEISERLLRALLCGAYNTRPMLVRLFLTPLSSIIASFYNVCILKIKVNISYPVMSIWAFLLGIFCRVWRFFMSEAKHFGRANCFSERF